MSLAMGWCITGHHSKCPGVSVMGLKCVCAHDGHTTPHVKPDGNAVERAVKRK